MSVSDCAFLPNCGHGMVAADIALLTELIAMSKRCNSQGRRKDGGAEADENNFQMRTVKSGFEKGSETFAICRSIHCFNDPEESIKVRTSRTISQ